MGLSTNLISGLSSGFDWRSVIDQLIAIEHRRVDLVEEEQTQYKEKLEILQTINSKLLTLKSESTKMADFDTFKVFTSSLSTNSSSYSASDFLSVTTNTDATPGSHTITMNANSSVAQARQISSKSFSGYDTDLDLAGEFIINGRAVAVEDGDSLQDIKNKINNLNTGTDATGVTASILTASSSNYRLILTSDNTGKDAFTIFDASSDGVNILSSGLGFTDGTTSIKNYISNGVQSESFASSSSTVQSIMGLNTAQNGSVTIGSFAVTIDLADSLTDIAADINTAANAAGSNVSASVVSTTEDNVTTYRLKIENTTNFTDANNVLQTLGILDGDQGSVEEVHVSDTANTLVAGGGPIVEGTRFNEIDTTGSPGNNVGVGDTITIMGIDHDGNTVSGTFDPADMQTATVGDLLDEIESVFGLSAGSATIDANGRIQIQDDSSGDSQLSIQLIANNEEGGTLNLGTLSATNEGYTMQVRSGQDASVIIDGMAITSSSNIIDDVIAGVSLNLLTVESGSTVNLTVSRDFDTIKASVQNLLDAYNDIIADINEQFAYDEETETAGLLQGDGTLSSIKFDITNIAISAISDISTSMNAFSLIGINTLIDYSDHSNDGKLTIDDDDFMDALRNNFNDFARVFIAEGSTTDGDVEYISHTNDTVAGEYDIEITTAASQATVTGSSTLTTGIGAANIEVLSIVQGDRVGSVILNGASGENGSSIDNIVNAINSELDAKYTQTLMGSVKNTTDASQTTAITSSTKWDSVYSGGTLAGLASDEVITFTGHRNNGTEVTGSYTISDVSSDTVQGLLSAIEASFDYEVTAAINSNGYLQVTSKTTGNSQLDITVTGPTDKNLDFGTVTTSNLVGSVRNTTDGTNAILSTTTWDGIHGSTVTTGDVFQFAGYTSSGNDVYGSFTVDLGNTSYDDVGDFLSEIESAFNAAGGNVTASISDGRVMLSDGATNSTVGMDIIEPSGKGVSFGTFSGGTTGRYAVDVTASKDGSDQLVLTHDEYGSGQSFTIQVSNTNLGLTDNQTYSGVDVAGTINGEAATGAGQVLTGNAPAEGETTSIEGLVIKYTGTTTGSQGQVKITMGVAELMDRTLFNITDQYEGYLAFKLDSYEDKISDFDTKIEEMEALLDQKMELMINNFVSMELALSKIQQMSNWLTGQVQAANSAWG
ncbi:MAG: flagellar filament capping protein FliD [Deltaproteobacteria bacterium]|nr:flagellar filament capping protein FliD [Deltaproteobacteria bacterium]